MILGIDEAGRGPWAGPLVVGACVLGGAEIEGLTDSKKLTAKKRKLLEVEIKQQALGWGLGWVTAAELDEIGVSEALRQATRRAVEQVSTSYSEIIIDGTQNFLDGTGKGRYVKTLKKADLLIPSVSAASILAKVARDEYMTQQDVIYPEYGFAKHVGYGTAMHKQALETYGPTPLHRMSYRPLAELRIVTTKHDVARTSGALAEEKVATFLESEGHEIIAKNWRNTRAEIDIVSLDHDILYFTEVKYRRNDKAGSGLDAVTPKKLAQMKFAVENYIHANKYPGEVRLAVAYLSGDEIMLNDWFVLEA